MPKVDLGRLERERRITVHEDVAPDDPMWEGSEIHLLGPLEARLEAQKVGADVIVRGQLRGEVGLECRRCLKDVTLEFDESVSFLYRAGLEPAEAAAEEVYPLPARARELDLGEPIREHLLLSVPKYVVCCEACRGLCPRCGTDLNVEECRCEATEFDDRWAPLRKLKED